MNRAYLTHRLEEAEAELSRIKASVDPLDRRRASALRTAIGWLRKRLRLPPAAP